MSGRTTTVRRHIEAPPETVWALLTDADSYDAWNDAVVSLEGPIETGSTIKLVSVVNPDRTFKLKVAEMDSPRHMVWSDGMPLGLFKGERTFKLASVGGGTEFTMTEVFSGLMAGLIVKSIPDMTESFNQFADGLKAAAESRRDG
jgi:uncharacterized protein YndB with AHSA1/START domain